ncbi:MAG TPA: hypothetical protein PLY96_11645, partial [Chromatiaceae bacterium]|nr:hypothetical protein [Chromatiaceae bacterium]
NRAYVDVRLLAFEFGFGHPDLPEILVSVFWRRQSHLGKLPEQTGDGKRVGTHRLEGGAFIGTGGRQISAPDSYAQACQTRLSPDDFSC